MCDDGSRTSGGIRQNRLLKKPPLMTSRHPDSRNRHRGFTLVELTIALVVISLLAASIFVGGSSLIDMADRKATIKQLLDLRAASAQFKERYRFLPGDFPVGVEIATVSAACRIGGSGAGNGDGLIQRAAAGASESTCAVDHLYQSGLLANPLLSTKYGAMGIMSRAEGSAYFTATTGTASTNNVRDTIRNVIVLENIPCSLAHGIDEALDDGNLANPNGTVAGFSGACVGSSIVWLAVGL